MEKKILTNLAMMTFLMSSTAVVAMEAEEKGDPNTGIPVQQEVLVDDQKKEDGIPEGTGLVIKEEEKKKAPLLLSPQSLKRKKVGFHGFLKAHQLQLPLKRRLLQSDKTARS